MGYIFRFIFNSRKPVKKKVGSLDSNEVNKAELSIIRFVQQIEFSEELKMLSKYQPVSGKSRLKCLNPFLDEQNIIRVGGRLENSELTYNAKQPIILPAKHNLN